MGVRAGWSPNKKVKWYLRKWNFVGTCDSPARRRRPQFRTCCSTSTRYWFSYYKVRGTGLRHSSTGRGTGTRIKSTRDCVIAVQGVVLVLVLKAQGIASCVVLVCGTLLESVMYCYCYKVQYGYLVLVVLCDPLVHHIHHKPYNAVGQYSSIFV